MTTPKRRRDPQYTYPPITQPRVWTPETFRSRCIELMETHGAGWWSCRATAHDVRRDTGDLAWIEVAVPSASRAHTLYDARYVCATDMATCNCIAASRHQPCWHIGVAIACGRRAFATNREMLLNWGRQEAWEGNDAALKPSL